jgi:hypothetical protein
VSCGEETNAKEIKAYDELLAQRDKALADGDEEAFPPRQ